MRHDCGTACRYGHRLGAGLLALGFAAHAGTADAATTCSGSGSSMSLGIYPSYSSTPVDAVGAVLVTCSRQGGPPETTVTVGIGPSQASGTVAQRQLRQTGGGDLLSYNLYREAARLSVWGHTPGVDTVSQTIRLSNKSSGTLSFNIFSRIAARQDVRAGAYADAVIVTVDF